MRTQFVHYKSTCVQRRPADTLHFLSNTFSPTRPSPSEGFALRSGRSLWAGRSTASGRARGACPCALTCLKIASQVHAARCIPITASAPLFLSERPRAPRPRPFHHPSLLFQKSVTEARTCSACTHNVGEMSVSSMHALSSYGECSCTRVRTGERQQLHGAIVDVHKHACLRPAMLFRTGVP